MRKSNIFLICGSGGVGKTTVAASLGLHLAGRGCKTIVLTIDPARRLATSLGLKELSDIPRRIEVPSMNGGEMWAMMLDTKRTFDGIVEKYAPSPEAARAILGNRTYQQMSRMLAGTQEYMAMEKLFEIWQDDQYEMIVLDTPPMQNALDFLTAPQRMMNMINHSMLHLFLKPTLFLGKSGFKMLEKGTRPLMKILDRIAGFAFLQELAEMFVALKDLLGGFRSRAEQVRGLLADPNCAFVSVCTTSDQSLEEVEHFRQELGRLNYRLGHVIVNRAYHGPPFPEGELPGMEAQLESHVSARDAVLLRDNLRQFAPLIERDRQRIARLERLMGASNVSVIPLFLSDVHDLEGLGKVAALLKDF